MKFEEHVKRARAFLDEGFDGSAGHSALQALEALAAERAEARRPVMTYAREANFGPLPNAKRAAALDALALLDADEICPDRVATATARVAAAREAAPEPVSVGSWGMH